MAVNGIPPMAEEEIRRKSRQESDVTMVTLLQPSEMLKSEMLLHEASRKNNIDKVKQLIADKVNVNAKNHLDRTALQWAAANNNVEIMELLIKCGAEVEAADKYGMNAMLWTAHFGHVDAMKFLVTHGANTRCCNRQGQNILHCAAENNHVNILHFIHESLEGFDIDAVEKNERTALHLAAEKGHVDVVEKLLAMKCDINKKDKEGQTAVHVAAACGKVDVLKKFLLAGIEVDDRDTEGRSALHLAAMNGHNDVVEELLTCNADPNAETTKEMTPLHMAAQGGHMDVVTNLLDHGCNVNAQNYQGSTALHLAASNNHTTVVNKLVSVHQCEINLVNKRAQTALHAAVENGHSDVVEALLIAGADIAATEKTGKTPLGLASRGSFIGIVDMIIKADRYQQSKRDEKQSQVQCGKYHHCFYSATCNALTSHHSRSSSESNDVQFKRASHEGAAAMKDILWKLATKQLKPNDWKKLAKHWNFSEAHVRAIEHQYTGPNSYKEHGYRLLLIWLHGIKKEDNPVKQLFEALIAIGRRELAEQIRRKCNFQVERSTSTHSCVVS